MNKKQWQQIEGYAASDLNDDYAICLLELRDRVVAMEGQQREAAMNELRPASAEVRPATGEPTDRELRELFWYRPKGPETEAAALRRVYQAGMAAAVQSSAQREIADAEAFGLTSTSVPVFGAYGKANDREVIYPLNREDGKDRPSVLPAPASSLVERVADAIVTKATSAGIVDDRPARAAIREVAVAARSRGDQPFTWEHVAQWLEQEADR